ncbi:MAG: hypothetical protein ACK4RK_11130 [Gemmataceae bacterium]
MMSPRWFLVVLLLLLRPVTVWAEPYHWQATTQKGSTVRLHLDRRQVELSGSLRLTLTIEGSAPLQVSALRDMSKSPAWRVTAQPPTLETLPDGRQRWQQTFTLEPWLPGQEVSLPLHQIEWNNEQVTLPAVTVAVTTQIPRPDVSLARDITGIETLPPTPARPVAWLLAMGAGLLAAGLVAVGWRRWRLRPPPPPAPDAEALAHLRRLADQKPGSAVVAPELLAMLRRYLERGFQISAEVRTTEELLAMLATPPWDSATHERLQALLRRCDLIQFAGWQPDAEEARELLDQARAFVEATAPSRAG